MYPAAECLATVVYKEALNYLFIQEAPIEENTSSECMCTVAA